MNNKYVYIDQYKTNRLHHEYKIPSGKFLQSKPIYQNEGLGVPNRSVEQACTDDEPWYWLNDGRRKTDGRSPSVETCYGEVNLPCKNSLNSIHPSPSISKQLKTNLNNLYYYLHLILFMGESLQYSHCTEVRNDHWSLFN